MAFVAAAIGIGGVASAVAGYLGTTQAANAQVSAENQALQAQNQARGQLQPFINAGAGATNLLSALTGGGGIGGAALTPPNYNSFFQSPDYQFAQQQGELGLQRYENANGLALSGGALKDAAEFNQGLATQTYGNYFNRLLGLATLGNNAATAGVGGANAAAGTIGNIGASQASGIIGGTNAITGGINSGISNSLLYNAINRSSYAGYGTPQSPFPSLGDLGIGNGVGTGGYNFIDAGAK